MKRILLLLLFLAFCCPFVLRAQQQALLLPVRIEGRYGFIDRSGTVVIPPQYDWAGFFRDGYAPVMKEGKVLLIRSDGSLENSSGFDFIEMMGDSLILVRSGNKWGINLVTGRTIVPCRYDEIRLTFDKNLIGFREDSLWGFCTRRGLLLLPAVSDTGYAFRGKYLRYERNGLSGLVKFDGTPLLEAECDDINISDPLVFYMKNNRWGCITKSGNKLLDPVWVSYRFIRGGFIVLHCDSGSVLATGSGKLITSCGMYDDYVNTNVSGIVSVSQGGKFGLMDTAGRVIFPPEYDDFTPIEGAVWMYEKEGRFGLCNSGGDLLTKPLYDGIGTFYRHIGKVTAGNRTGVINIKGAVIVPLTTGSISVNRNVIKVKNPDGTISITETDSEGNLFDRNNYAQLKTIRIGGGGNNNGGTINSGGWNSVSSGDNDTLHWYFAGKMQRWGLKNDVTGDTIFKPIFTDIADFPRLKMTLVQLPGFCSGPACGKRKVKLPRKYGIVRAETGKYLLPAQYSALKMSDMTDNVFVGLIRAIRADGETGIIWPAKPASFLPMSYVESPVNGVSRICLGGNWREVSSQDSATCNFETLAAMFGSDYTGFILGFNPQKRWLRLENGKWGFMDSEGNFLIEPVFEDVKDYRSGYAIVKKNGKWGVYGRKNVRDGFEFSVAPQYDRIEYVEASDKKFYIVEQNNPKQGFINRSGEIAVSASFDRCRSFTGGRIAVMRDGKWGFADSLGNMVVPFEFNDARPFSEGLAAVKKSGKWGFIDSDGELVTEQVYESVTPFENGCSYVRRNGKAMIIDRQGNAIPLEKNLQVTGIIGHYRIVKGKKGLGLIDETSKWVLKPVFGSIQPYAGDSIFLVKKKQVYGIISREGRWICKPGLMRVSDPSEGIRMANENGKWGCLDEQGRWSVAPQFTRVQHFSQGLAAVKLSGKWGYIRPDGAFAIEPVYYAAGDFSEDLAFVSGKDGTGYIDRSGKIVIPVHRNSAGQPFHEGMALVRDPQGDCYFINTIGQKLFGRSFEDASGFEHGVARIKTNKGWGMMNKNGLIVLEPRLAKIDDFDGPLASFVQLNFFGVVNQQGEQLIAPIADRIVQMDKDIYYIQNGRAIGYLMADGHWLWEGKR